MQTGTTTERIVENQPFSARRRAVFVAAGLLGAAAVLGVPVFAVVERLQSALGAEGNFAVTYVFAGTLATLLQGAMALLYLRVRPVDIPVRVPTRRDLGYVVGMIVVAFLVTGLLGVVGGALGVEQSTNLFERAAVDDPLLVYGAAFLMFVLLVGPVEELLYRGVVQGRLREVFGPAAAIGLTSLLFAVGHVASYWIGGSDMLSVGVVVALASNAAFAALAGVVYERTGNLTVVTLAHSLINGIPAGVLFVSAL